VEKGHEKTRKKRVQSPKYEMELERRERCGAATIGTIVYGEQNRQIQNGQLLIGNAQSQ